MGRGLRRPVPVHVVAALRRGPRPCARCGQIIKTKGHGPHRATHLHGHPLCEQIGCGQPTGTLTRFGALACWRHLGHPPAAFRPRPTPLEAPHG